MFTIAINPVAFSLGTIEVRWYGVAVVFAVLAIIFITLVEARRLDIASDHI